MAARGNFEFVRQVMQTRAVRQKIADVANRVASGTQRIARAEGVSGGVSRQDGTRPKGRPFARVTMAPGAPEFGTAEEPRRRVLGRAASAAARTDIPRRR